MKKFLSIMMTVMVAFGAAACAQADETPLIAYAEVEFTKADLNTSWDDSATTIEMNGAAAIITGEGAALENGVILISQPGDYVLSGTFTGSVRVEIDKEKKAHIILNGAAITASGAPALAIISADKVTLTLADGTVNALTDSADYALADGEDEPNACLYSKEDLSVNGGGALTVTGLYMHGINCKDDLRIAGGGIAVSAAADGIRGKDSLAVCGGTITVQSGEDGFKSGNDADEGKGLIAVSGGSITIAAGNDGMQAAQKLLVTGGAIAIQCGEGAGDVTASDYTDSRGGWNMFGNWDMGNASSAVSMKGLKSDGDMMIAGGDITVDAEDDALHAAGDISIADGVFTLSSGDDGIHTDAALLIVGGNINVLKSYEGFEGCTITITGGTHAITASDDGINAAGEDTASAQATTATDRNGFGPSGGRGMMMDANAGNVLRITGGSLYVNASGDGLDSNGYLYIEGGVVIVDGPSNSGNGALDSGYSVSVTGGTLIAAGASGMEETPDSSSTQRSIYAQASLSAGDLFAVTDASGKLLVAFTAAKSHSSVIVSSPELTDGAAYTLYKGGSASGESVNGAYLTGAYSGGTALATVTVSGNVTSTGGGSNQWNQWNNRNNNKRGW